MVMLSEGSSVKGSPEDKQPSGPCIRGSAKISRRVTLALYTGQLWNTHPKGCGNEDEISQQYELAIYCYSIWNLYHTLGKRYFEQCIEGKRQFYAVVQDFLHHICRICCMLDAVYHCSCKYQLQLQSFQVFLKFF